MQQVKTGLSFTRYCTHADATYVKRKTSTLLCGKFI